MTGKAIDKSISDCLRRSGVVFSSCGEAKLVQGIEPNPSCYDRDEEDDQEEVEDPMIPQTLKILPPQTLKKLHHKR